MISPSFSRIPYFVAFNRIRRFMPLERKITGGKKKSPSTLKYLIALLWFSVDAFGSWDPLATYFLASTISTTSWYATAGTSELLHYTSHRFVCHKQCQLSQHQICCVQQVSKTAMNWKLFCYLFSMPDGTGISAISSGFGAKCDWHICISYPVNFIPGLFRYIKPPDAHHISSFPNRRDSKTILSAPEAV